MKKGVYVLAVFAVILIAFSLITFSVSEKESAVVTRFGKPVRVIKDAGLKFKLPGFFETINPIDHRINVFVTQPIQLLLGDKNPIILTCYVCWRVFDPLLYFQSVAVLDVAQQKLADMINSQLGSVLGEYSLDEIINTAPEQVKLRQIEDRILTNSNINAMKKYGAEVIQLGIRRLNYPSIVAQAVFDRMQSEREKEAKKYRAEGTEEASKIKAKTDREVSEILASAYEQSEQIKGKGDMEAIKIYGDAYSRNREFFDFSKSLELYSEMLKERSTLVISTQNDLFRYLTSPEGR